MKRETLQNATFLIWLAGGILAATIVLIANSMGIDSFTIEPTDLTSIENRLRKVLDQETVNGAMADLEESVKGRLLETRTKDQMRVELLKDLPQGLDEKTIGQIVMSSKRRVIGIYYSRVLELYLPWIVIMAAALFKEEERVVVYRPNKARMSLVLSTALQATILATLAGTLFLGNLAATQSLQPFAVALTSLVGVLVQFVFPKAEVT